MYTSNFGEKQTNNTLDWLSSYPLCTLYRDVIHVALGCNLSTHSRVHNGENPLSAMFVACGFLNVERRDIVTCTL